MVFGMFLKTSVNVLNTTYYIRAPLHVVLTWVLLTPVMLRIESHGLAEPEIIVQIQHYASEVVNYA